MQSGAILPTVLTIVTWLTSLMRWIVRLRMLKSFGWDDKVMILAQILFTVFAASSFADTTGKPPSATETLKILLLSETSYVVCTTTVKVAVALFLLRVVTRRLYTFILYGAIALAIAMGFANFLVLMLQCRPLSKSWRPAEPGSCLDPRKIVDVNYAYSAVSIATDFTLAILPVFVVRKLHAGMRTKAAAMAILAMGTVAGIATIIRLRYIYEVETLPLSPTSAPQIIHSLNLIGSWSFVEPGVGIIAANLATFRPLLRYNPFRHFRHSAGDPKACAHDIRDTPSKDRHRPTDRLYPSVSTDVGDGTDTSLHKSGNDLGLEVPDVEKGEGAKEARTEILNDEIDQIEK